MGQHVRCSYEPDGERVESPASGDQASVTPVRKVSPKPEDFELAPARSSPAADEDGPWDVRNFLDISPLELRATSPASLLAQGASKSGAIDPTISREAKLSL